MNYIDHDTLVVNDIKILNYLPDIGMDSVREEILEGLSAAQKYISPKFFYDKKGSGLFEKITQLEEYYPTRTEKRLLRKLFDVIHIDLRDLDIIELGSGDASKIKLLFEQIPENTLDTMTYFPVDISPSAIEQSAKDLSESFNTLSITGIVADFYHQLNMIPGNRQRLFCFLGSTIGNFSSSEAEKFMTLLGAEMKPGDGLLLGVDMVKDVQVLENAYNDKDGITEAFNFNILNVVNDLTGSDFNPDDFEHFSYYNINKNRIEMHLRALKNVEVHIPSLEDPEVSIRIRIRKGETLHTENSYKYTNDQIHQLGEWAGLIPESMITDPKQWFSMVHFVKT